MLSILSKLLEHVKLLFSFWFIIHKGINIENKLLVQSDKVTKNDKLISLIHSRSHFQILYSLIKFEVRVSKKKFNIDEKNAEKCWKMTDFMKRM
jgi:hypothetical protein